MEEWCSSVEQRILNMHYSLIRIMQQNQVRSETPLDGIVRCAEIYVFNIPPGGGEGARNMEI